MNMSVETFIVSLEVTYNSILSNPFGVGFNRYQNAHKKFIDEIVKINKNVKKNNIYDGSTNLSKIPTEFGIFGIFFIVYPLYPRGDIFSRSGLEFKKEITITTGCSHIS